MCYVYTLDEFSQGRVPSTRDYVAAREALVIGLGQFVERQLIYGATLIGSITYSDFEIGSDIDLFVLTESRDADDRLRDLSLSITDSTNVHIDAKVVSRAAAESGQHGLSFHYVETTKHYCGEWTIGRDPTGIVAPSERWNHPQSELKDECVVRLAALTKARLRTRPDYGKGHCSFLDRILTLPIYLAINVVRLIVGRQPSRRGTRMSKEETCRMYGELLPGGPSGTLLELLARKQRYRAALVRRDTAPEVYRALLEAIDDGYPLACDFMEQNLSILASTRLA